MNPAIPIALAWVAAAIFSFLDGRRPVVAWSAVGTLGVITASAVAVTAIASSQGTQTTLIGGWPGGIGIGLRGDVLGGVFLSVSCISLTAAMAHEAMTDVRSRTFPAFMLFLAAGLSGLFFTADVFNFYVFFELSMTASFVLALYGQRRGEIRAAFIFVMVNILGSLFFLVAVVGLYRVTGTLDMSGIARAGVPPGVGLAIAAVLLAAFSVKLGLFPFHTWIPPVYRDTSPAVAAVLSGAVANIGSYGLLRFGTELLPRELERGALLLFVLGGMSILYGGIVALSRTSVREVLAYSSISQVGYILLALATGGALGLAAVVVYTVVNSLNKTALFLSSEGRSVSSGMAFAVGAISVAGVPPAAGFLGKAAVLRSGTAHNDIVLLVLVMAGTALSFLYMFRIYQRRCWIGAMPEGVMGQGGAAAGAVACLLLAIGLWPQALLGTARRAIDMIVVGG